MELRFREFEEVFELQYLNFSIVQKEAGTSLCINIKSPKYYVLSM